MEGKEYSNHFSEVVYVLTFLHVQGFKVTLHVFKVMSFREIKE